MNLFYTAYLPRQNVERLDWLIDFNQTLPTYASEFNITPAQLESIAQDTAALQNARVTLDNYTQTFKKSVTSYANELDTDPTPNDLAQPIFNPPTVSPTVQSGLFARLDVLIQSQILPTANVTQLTALRLNPIAATSSATPTISQVEAMARGQVGLTMNRGGSKITVIHSRRAGETAFAPLDKVADTHYLDTRPNQVAGTSEAREYQIEWSFNGTTGDGHLSPIARVATLA